MIYLFISVWCVYVCVCAGHVVRTVMLVRVVRATRAVGRRVRRRLEDVAVLGHH